MGGCGSVADKEQLARDLDRIAREKALEASECELRLQTDDGDAVSCVLAYGLETAGALLARQAERLGLPAAGLELEFSNELVPAECALQGAGIMEVCAPPAGPVLTDSGQGATVRVLGVAAGRQKLAQKLVRTDADIRAAVQAWLSDPVRAEAEYGHITEWNVKAVTDMHQLFYDARSFNQDVSGWDVSNVANMEYMFFCASSFNQDVSGWDVSNVTTMRYMFKGASRFNQDVSGWDVSNVTDMTDMFGCSAVHGNKLPGPHIGAMWNKLYM